jgi:hypothetical protein
MIDVLKYLKIHKSVLLHAYNVRILVPLVYILKKQLKCAMRQVY